MTINPLFLRINKITSALNKYRKFLKNLFKLENTLNQGTDKVNMKLENSKQNLIHLKKKLEKLKI
jgi:hypothetical protein